MANSGLFTTPFAGEKILHTRANISQSASVIDGSKKNNGALVIDPNKLIDDAGTIVDRYVKQEDLVTYCSLIAFKKPELTVEDSGSTRNVRQESPKVQINFLNPLQTNASKGVAATYKNKYTTEWSEFFTSDAANDSTSQDYIVDPETFGIADIDVAVNASQIPRITIRFIDVQGRTLFERGNDPNNPYNIFFTYPYPYFILTYKGYYGKAVQFPMVLIKSNSRFDPNTGNYEITAEFQAEIFSTLNTFLVMYAYAAPYMFPISGGTYLGKRILERLYERQNVAISSALGTDGDVYQINNAPTLLDLANAITAIPYNTLNNTNNTTLTTAINDQLLQIKQDIDTYSFGILDYLNNNTNFRQSNKNGIVVYTPINNNNITTKNPVNLLDLINNFNEAVKSFKSIAGTTNTTALNASKKVNDTIDIIKSTISNNNQLKTDVSTYLGKFNMDSVVIPELFYYKGDPNTYSVADFEIVQLIIQNNIDNVQIGIEDTYANNKMKDIKDAIGYEPTMSNILRIIANNMQTFMILLELVGMNAANQIKVSENRRLNHKRNTTYKSSINSGINYYTPFPNYNKEIDDVSNGTPIKRKVLTYPGDDTTNSDWFEIALVDEIYNATDRIRKFTIGSQDDTLFNPQKSGLSTIFPMGDFDLTSYENKTDMKEILKEFVLKYNMHSMLSGVYYRGIDISSVKSSYSKTIADYEFELMNDVVFSAIKNTAQQNILGNKLKKATSKQTTKTNLGSLAKTFAPNASFHNIITQTKKEINEYNKLQYLQGDLAIINSAKKTETGGYSLYYGIPQPENYSILSSTGKAKSLGVYPDLTANSAYIVQGTGTGSQLSALAIATNKVNSQVNFFGGFMVNMNRLLQDNGSWNFEFSNRVEYANTTVPALTYNTTLSVINANGELFTKVAAPQTNLSTIYKQF